MNDNIVRRDKMGFAEMGFKGLKQKFAPYISVIAKNCKGRDRLNDRDDIVSMLETVLWECSEKYREVDEVEFTKLFKTAASNHMATLMTSKRIERSETIVGMDNFHNGKRGYYKPADIKTRTEMTDKNYQNIINDILVHVSPQTAMVVMEVMDPENRGKFIKGSKQAFGEIKKYLQG